MNGFQPATPLNGDGLDAPPVSEVGAPCVCNCLDGPVKVMQTTVVLQPTWVSRHAEVDMRVSQGVKGHADAAMDRAQTVHTCSAVRT